MNLGRPYWMYVELNWKNVFVTILNSYWKPYEVCLPRLTFIFYWEVLTEDFHDGLLWQWNLKAIHFFSRARKISAVSHWSRDTHFWTTNARELSLIHPSKTLHAFTRYKSRGRGGRFQSSSTLSVRVHITSVRRILMRIALSLGQRGRFRIFCLQRNLEN